VTNVASRFEDALGVMKSLKRRRLKNQF